MKNNTHMLVRAVIIDAEHILLCKTLDLQHNFYFLPGGHVEHGESAASALVRELMEESGFKVTIKRFLGCLERGFESSESCKCHNQEYSFIFEVGAADLTINSTIPKLEVNMELVWVPITNIAQLPFKAEELIELIPQWLALNLDQSFRTTMA